MKYVFTCLIFGMSKYLLSNTTTKQQYLQVKNESKAYSKMFQNTV